MYADSPDAPDGPSHYLPKHAQPRPDGRWYLNGVVATGDDDFCVTIFPDEWDGVARLTHEDPDEFRDRLIQMRVVTITVYQRDVSFANSMQQHKVTLVRGDDLLWRVAPLDNFSAGLLFTPTREPNHVPWNVADAVLALHRTQFDEEPTDSVGRPLSDRGDNVEGTDACYICGGPESDHGSINGYPDKHAFDDRGLPR